MKNRHFIFPLSFFLVWLIVMPELVRAQCTCDQIRLKNIMDNAQIQFLNSSGNPVTSLSPDTEYTLRIRATSFICSQNGAGCNSISAPISFIIKIADGCLVFDSPVPPATGRDVGPANNYTANIRIKTLDGDDFSDVCFFRIGSQCFPSPDCTVLDSNSLGDRLVILP